jgi:hypothetical protein
MGPCPLLASVAMWWNYLAGEKGTKKEARARSPCFPKKRAERVDVLAVAQANRPEFLSARSGIETTQQRFERRRPEHGPIPEDILSHNRSHQGRRFGALLRGDWWDGKMHGILVEEGDQGGGGMCPIIPDFSSARYPVLARTRGRRFTVNGNSLLS